MTELGDFLDKLVEHFDGPYVLWAIGGFIAGLLTTWII